MKDGIKYGLGGAVRHAGLAGRAARFSFLRGTARRPRPDPNGARGPWMAYIFSYWESVRGIFSTHRHFAGSHWTWQVHTTPKQFQKTDS